MEDTGRPNLKRKASDAGNGTRKRVRYEGLTWAQITQSPLITLRVESETYHLHKGLLIQESQHFAAKDRAGWNSNETSFTLVSITNDGFKVVLDWMNNRRLSSSLDAPNNNVDRGAAMKLTAKAYKAAHQLRMPELQNQLLNNLVHRIVSKTHEWNFDNLQELHTEGLRSTKLYKFVLDSAIWNIVDGRKPKSAYDVALETLQNNAPEILREITEATLQWQRDSRLRPDTNLQRYHVRRNSVAFQRIDPNDKSH